MTEEKIKFEGTIFLADGFARNELRRLETKIDTINERTKSHTLDIKKLEKEIKKWKKH